MDEKDIKQIGEVVEKALLTNIYLSYIIDI